MSVFFCKTGSRGNRGPTAGLISSAVLVSLFLVFSAACGRHQAQVKPPVLKPSAPPAAKTEPAPKQAQQAPPLAPVQNNIPKSIPPESAASVPEPSTIGFDLPPGPLIRIGLTTDAKEIRVSSTGDYYVSDKTPEAPQQLVHGETVVRVEQEVDESSAIYRVQVASLSRSDLALELKRKLSEMFAQPVIIHENTAAGLNQVRIGEFSSKDEAQAFQKTLAKSGYSDAFVVKEAMDAEGGGTTLALRGPKNLFRLSRAGFLFQPAARTAFIRVDGKPYRGILDINLNKHGRLTVINQLGTEEYLLGVVPAEISPSSYPESAALAAQAIAARTKALFLKNGGNYRSEGFDLTDDTRTQVYEGVAAEKEATNAAVRQTAGLAIYYQDALIDAMFMSTCGGRTEDFANVFDSAPVPYLKSVFCAIESGPDKGETVLQGKHDLEEIVLTDDGTVANRNVELARALGMIQAGTEVSPLYLTGAAGRDELLNWVEISGKIAQKAQPVTEASIADLRSRVGFLRYAAEAFFGSAEIKRRMSPRDVDYYMGNLKDGDAVPEPARWSLSYLIQSGLWRPYADNTVRPDQPMCRGDAISLLLRWIESARPDILKKGTFVSAGATRDDEGSVNSINVKWGNRTQEFRLSQAPYIFRVDSGRTTPVSSLRIIGNEKLAFHVSPQGAIDFLQVELSPTGASSDRYSPVASWDSTLSRSAIAEKLRGLAPNIGEFRDMKPYKTGNSGRAVQIQVVGSRNSVVLNGYKVRNALGLKDTLFTLTREYTPDGSIVSFTFHGRGWGHGVGLCQVGAFGMARAGRSYEEILKTYYQGVQIRKAY